MDASSVRIERTHRYSLAVRSTRCSLPESSGKDMMGELSCSEQCSRSVCFPSIEVQSGEGFACKLGENFFCKESFACRNGAVKRTEGRDETTKTVKKGHKKSTSTSVPLTIKCVEQM